MPENDSPVGAIAVCSQCGTGFTKKRKHQQYDTPKCRKKAFEEKFPRIERSELERLRAKDADPSNKTRAVARVLGARKAHS